MRNVFLQKIKNVQQFFQKRGNAKRIFAEM